MTGSPEQRLLVVSPIRNEAGHFERVARAMSAQARPPDVWVVVDDGSTDETPAILELLAGEIDFLRARRVADPSSAVPAKDRLASAAAPRAFNRGLESVPWRTFTHIAKLDGDVELPPHYFEVLLARFREDPRLGIAGGIRAERETNGWRLERPPLEYHVPGALKCYTRECLESFGGIPERLAWDTIDEVYARMRGYRTQAFPDLVAVHHRAWGSADGSLRGRARHGRCAYVAHYSFPWVAARAFRRQPARPRALSSLLYIGGYGLAAVRRTERVEDPEFRTFMRRELRARMLHAVRSQVTTARLSLGGGARGRATLDPHG